MQRAAEVRSLPVDQKRHRIVQQIDATSALSQRQEPENLSASGGQSCEAGLGGDSRHWHGSISCVNATSTTHRQKVTHIFGDLALHLVYSPRVAAQRPSRLSKGRLLRIPDQTHSLLRRVKRPPGISRIGSPVEVLAWWATTYPAEWQGVIRRWSVESEAAPDVVETVSGEVAAEELGESLRTIANPDAEFAKGKPRKGMGKLVKRTPHAAPPAPPVTKRGGSGGPAQSRPPKSG